MAKTNKIKTKVSSYGRNLTLSMTADRFAALADRLPEGSEERIAIEKMVAESHEIKTRDELKSKLSQPLSKETLERFGWDIHEAKDIITAGVRHGDFRLDSRSQGEGWVFGPAGAFDREDKGRKVIKDAWQAGVFCQKHSAFLLEDPVQKADEAKSMAAALADSWHKNVPKVIKPAPAHLDDTHPGLPEGARIMSWGARSTGSMLSHKVRHGYDKPVYTDNEGRRVDVLKFDVCLRVDRYDVLKDLTWGPAAREYDPRWDTHKYVFDGPLDCIVGNAWGAVANTNPQTICGVSEAYPYVEEAVAKNAAHIIAMENNFIEGESGEYPDVLPVPPFAIANQQSDNPFA